MKDADGKADPHQQEDDPMINPNPSHEYRGPNEPVFGLEFGPGFNTGNAPVYTSEYQGPQGKKHDEMLKKLWAVKPKEIPKDCYSLDTRQ